MKKKICFIAHFPPPMHGLTKAVDTLYRSKLAEQYDLEKINIMSNKQILSHLWRIFRSKADLFYFPISQSRGGNLRDLVILKLLQLQHKTCLIHLHGGFYRELVEHHMPAWQKKANYKAIRRLAGTIALGNSLKHIFEGMIAEEKIFVVPNCVDDEFLMDEPDFDAKMAAQSDKQVKHVLYLSNFIREKGYPEILELARMEKARMDGGTPQCFHFDFAGKFFEPAEETFFFDYIKEHGLSEIVTYHGVVGGHAKQALLQQGDVFMLPTRYPNEGQPISILEAMGNGMVIVTTNHAGIPDVVQDQINGIVLDKTHIDLADCDRRLREMLADEKTFRTVAQENRRLVLDEYMEHTYIQNMCDCIGKLI